MSQQKVMLYHTTGEAYHVHGCLITVSWLFLSWPDNAAVIQDVATVWQRVRAAAVVHDSVAGRALSPSRTRSSSPVREGSLTKEQLKNNTSTDHAPVSFHVVVEVSHPVQLCSIAT